MKTLQEIIARLAAIDEEVRGAKTADEVTKLQSEKTDLIARKAELEDLEERKKTALALSDGSVLGKPVESRGVKKEDEDIFDSVEYRKAFMNYCVKGTPIPTEYRDAYTAVADAAAVIPTTIMNEIIKESKQYGQLYNRYRKLNIQGGVKVPILSLKPTATRITEATVSDRKKLTANTYVTFSYYELECKVATSLLASTVSLPMFESQIVPIITEAMVKTNEYESFNGDGDGEMLGILNDTRIADAQKISLSSTEFQEWDSWKKKVFAKIPLSYRAGGIFVMGAGTFDGYIDGMTDANGQPIGRTNYGISEAATYRFGGKEVLEVEEDILPSYDAADVDDVVAVFLNPANYAVNSNMQMTMYRWFDHDLNQWVDKAILINDGKLLDAAGVLLIKKGA